MSRTQNQNQNQTTSIATRKKGLHTFLARMGPEIQKVATKSLDAETLASLVYTEATRSPEILNALEEAPTTVASTIMLAAQLGLDPSGPLGHFYLIPRRNKVAGTNRKRWELGFIIGYKGLCELARRSGQIVRMNAGVVFEDELPENAGRFEWTEEPPECKHPRAFGIDRSTSKLVGAYAVAILPGGERVQVFLEKKEIEDRRKKGGKGFGWKDNYPAMARKSAGRALLNGGLVPLSPALSKAVAVENEVESQELHVVEAHQVEEAPARRDPLRAALQIEDVVEEPEEEKPIGLIDRILELEGELPSDVLFEFATSVGINPEADLESQDRKLLEAYATKLSAKVSQ